MALDDAFEDSAHETTNRENTIVSVLIIEVLLIYTMLCQFQQYSILTSLYITQCSPGLSVFTIFHTNNVITVLLTIFLTYFLFF